MKKFLFAVAATFAVFAAHATHCANGATDYPKCTPPVVTPSPTPSTPASTVKADAAAQAAADARAAAIAAQQQRQAQRQQQAQAQQTQVAVKNDAAGGASSSGGNTLQGGATIVDTGDKAGSGDSYKSLAISIPFVPPTPPSVVPSVNLTTTAMSCGPAQRIVATAVYGNHSGVFTDKQVFLGNTEKTEPYMDEEGKVKPYVVIDGVPYGHEVIYNTGALSVSSAANLTIGGGGNGGGWGQGGGGSSGAMQRILTTVQLRLCRLPVVVQPIAPPVQPPAVYVAPPVPQPRKAVKYRPKPAPRQCQEVNVLPMCNVRVSN